MPGPDSSLSTTKTVRWRSYSYSELFTSPSACRTYMDAPSFAKRMIDAGERQVCSRTFGLSMQPWLLALMESAGWLLNRLHALSRCCVRQGFANHSLDLFRHHQ